MPRARVMGSRVWAVVDVDLILIPSTELLAAHCLFWIQRDLLREVVRIHLWGRAQLSFLEKGNFPFRFPNLSMLLIDGWRYSLPRYVNHVLRPHSAINGRGCMWEVKGDTLMSDLDQFDCFSTRAWLGWAKGIRETRSQCPSLDSYLMPIISVCFVRCMI